MMAHSLMLGRRCRSAACPQAYPRENGRHQGGRRPDRRRDPSRHNRHLRVLIANTSEVEQTIIIPLSVSTTRNSPCWHTALCLAGAAACSPELRLYGPHHQLLALLFSAPLSAPLFAAPVLHLAMHLAVHCCTSRCTSSVPILCAVCCSPRAAPFAQEMSLMAEFMNNTSRTELNLSSAQRTPAAPRHLRARTCVGCTARRPRRAPHVHGACAPRAARRQ